LRHVDPNFKRRPAGQFPRPADNEFFRFAVQVAFTKGLRIQSIEKLADLFDLQFDDSQGTGHAAHETPSGMK
jgi:hypothetical protein